MRLYGALGVGMFGHNNHDQNKDDQTNGQPQVVEPVADGQLSDGAGMTSVTSVPTDSPPALDENRALPPPGFNPFAKDNQDLGSPALPSPTSDDKTGAPEMPDMSSRQADAAPPADDLMDIKKEALEKLNPLLGQLDQSPEEKFKTTMMMIQATDNQSLIGQAYEAALKIEDEKVRAQALLDVVNEINYFTQHHKLDAS